MLDKAHARLVTIIVYAEFQAQFERELKRLGARGWTVSEVDGRGLHGARKDSLFVVGNVRFETLVSPSVAEAILEYVDRAAETLEVVAFAQDVEAVPRKHFV
jgi:nitrogen regulatory protein PII